MLTGLRPSPERVNRLPFAGIPCPAGHDECTIRVASEAQAGSAGEQVRRAIARRKLIQTMSGGTGHDDEAGAAIGWIDTSRELPISGGILHPAVGVMHDAGIDGATGTRLRLTAQPW